MKFRNSVVAAVYDRRWNFKILSLTVGGHRPPLQAAPRAWKAAPVL